MYTTLIDAAQLADHIGDAEWIIVDCRFDLSKPKQGRQDYAAGHIPGAVYADLDDDLSAAEPVTDSGRHPLPSASALRATFGRLGIDETKQVVVYDTMGGVFASRLWWMLHYMQHKAVAVLNGGWDAWLAHGGEVKRGSEQNTATTFNGSPRQEMLVQADEVLQQPLLIDSRDAERYIGHEEPIDAVGGHIPGARNYYFANNWDGEKRMLPPEVLRQRLRQLLGESDPAEATFYCGSGVSACVNLLALAHAGLAPGKLYVGSWSEWSSDPQRPMVTPDG